MANTENDLINMALEEAGVKPATQAANVEDVALVQKRVALTIAFLIGKNVAIASDTADLSDIPDAIMLPLATCLAAQCATALMLSDPKKAELYQKQELAIRDLSLIYRQGFAGRRLNVPHIGRCWPVRRAGNYTTGT